MGGVPQPPFFKTLSPTVIMRRNYYVSLFSISR
jgi:hypothetical protein